MKVIHFSVVSISFYFDANCLVFKYDHIDGNAKMYNHHEADLVQKGKLQRQYNKKSLVI